MDAITLCLLVGLGSSIAYLLDAIFNVTPRIETWISAKLDEF